MIRFARFPLGVTSKPCLTASKVVRCLEHYHKVSNWTAQTAKMTDIDLEGFTIRCGGQIYRIPFDPPMDTLKDARPRLVEIDRLSTWYLRRSPTTVKEYVAPYGLYAVNFLVISAYWIVFSRRSWFEPGRIVEQTVGPQLANLAWSIQPRAFWGLLAVHASEVLYFWRYKLRKHSVSARSARFWLWTFSVLIEGIFAQKRFKELIAKKEAAKKQQQQH